MENLANLKSDIYFKSCLRPKQRIYICQVFKNTTELRPLNSDYVKRELFTNRLCSYCIKMLLGNKTLMSYFYDNTY